MDRRNFIQSLLAGTGLCLVKDQSPLVEVDQYFDTIQGVRCIPLDCWFNHIKAYDYSNSDRLFNIWLDQVPTFFPQTVVEDAIKLLPPKLPVYEEPFFGASPLKREENWFIKSQIPQFYVVNPRVGSFQNQPWLVIDILCAREDLAPELQYLSVERTKQLAEYMAEPTKPSHFTKEIYSWPEYWGVSGMGIDFWPFGKGDADLTREGLRIKQLEITNWRALTAAPFGGPTHLRYVWRGKHIGQLTCGLYARDYPSKEGNPFYQLSDEIINPIKDEIFRYGRNC